MEWLLNHFHKIIIGVFVCMLLLASAFYCALGAAVYWGLSIADDAVHNNNNVPTTVYVEGP